MLKIKFVICVTHTLRAWINMRVHMYSLLIYKCSSCDPSFQHSQERKAFKKPISTCELESVSNRCFFRICNIVCCDLGSSCFYRILFHRSVNVKKVLVSLHVLSSELCVFNNLERTPMASSLLPSYMHITEFKKNFFFSLGRCVAVFVFVSFRFFSFRFNSLMSRPVISIMNMWCVFCVIADIDVCNVHILIGTC